MARFYLITFCAHELLVEGSLYRFVWPAAIFGAIVGAHHTIGRSI